MSKVLFCIDSYYQLMIAVNLTVNRFKEDDVSVVLFKTMNNAEHIVKKLKESGLFEDIYLADTYLNRTVLNSSFLQRIPKYTDYLSSMARPARYMKGALKCQKIPYADQLFFYGYRPLVQCIFNACSKVNPNIRCYRMDDGMGSYTQEWNIPKPFLRKAIEKVMSCVFGFIDIQDYIDGFYVPDPSLVRYQLKYPLLEVPKYDDPVLIEKLNGIFGFSEGDLEQFKNKRVIYFAVYGKEWIERDIIYLKEITKYIPRDQIIVKAHPREDSRTFTDLGYDVVSNSTVPWEIFMINHGFPGALFVAQISSAIMSSRVIFKRAGWDMYLFECRDKSIKTPVVSSSEKLKDFLDFVQKKESDSSRVLLPQSLDELRIQLGEYMSMAL